MPLFLESLATKILEAGKYLHTIRECGRSPENPMARSATPPLQYSTDTRELGAAIEAAHKWAAAELMRELMVGGRLMERLASVKHYFLLDQASATPSPHPFVPAFAPPRPLTLPPLLLSPIRATSSFTSSTPPRRNSSSPSLRSQRVAYSRS